MALPKPGTDQQLRTLVSRLHMILLDRSRPLWQFYVIEGLQGGRFAIYAKLHHAAVDGGAGMVIMETIFISTPEPGELSPPPPPEKERNAAKSVRVDQHFLRQPFSAAATIPAVV